MICIIKNYKTLDRSKIVKMGIQPGAIHKFNTSPSKHQHIFHRKYENKQYSAVYENKKKIRISKTISIITKLLVILLYLILSRITVGI